MSFEIKLKDATAAFGYLHSRNAKIRIPAVLEVKNNLLITQTEEGNKLEMKMPDVVFKAPDGYFPAPLSTIDVEESWKIVGEWIVVIDWKKLPDFRNYCQELCIFPRGAELFQHPKDFVEAILAIRKAIGFGKLLYVPGIALPSRIALLSCLRIDLFDDALVRFLGEKGVLALSEGLLDGRERCVAQNLEALHRELEVIEWFGKEGRLRELVELRVRSESVLVAMLRYMDLSHYGFFERLWTVAGKKFYANSKESLWRIDVARYREKMKRYRGVNAELVLLLPCSAKKPYHQSRSHMRIEEVLKTAGRRANIHVVSLTSPLGLVPEELENFYPANAYDIPVTGHWDWEERQVVLEGLEPLLKNYKQVIAHLPADYEFVVKRFGFENTCVDGDVTSEKSLETLAKKIDGLGIERGNYAKRITDEVKNALEFQFSGMDTDFLKNAKIKGNRWNWIVLTGAEAFEMSESSGKILVREGGGRILAVQKIKCVETEEFELKGDVFVPGVVSASEDIRPGDEVVIVQKSVPVGTGTAVLSGIEMMELKRGLAVKMRERW
ncbi:MAG: DUF5591 domain-containing protein [Thermoplasmata archaeon]|nr:DUF5591 domain-containing protein [Thermoplasmata archaeon]